MVNFSEVVESKVLDGDKKKLEDVLDTPIVITGSKISASKYANTNKSSKFCTKIQFYYQIASGNGIMCHACSYRFRQSIKYDEIVEILRRNL